jgi:hypothetical protein
MALFGTPNTRTNIPSPFFVRNRNMARRPQVYPEASNRREYRERQRHTLLAFLEALPTDVLPRGSDIAAALNAIDGPKYTSSTVFTLFEDLARAGIITLANGGHTRRQQRIVRLASGRVLRTEGCELELPA